MGVEWIEHRGVRILRTDYRGCETEAEMLALLEKQGQQIRLRSAKTLLLANFEGTSISSGYMNEAKQRGAASGDQMLEKMAILGVTGLKGILLDGFVAVTGMRGKVQSFDTEAQALDWLVS